MIVCATAVFRVVIVAPLIEAIAKPRPPGVTGAGVGTLLEYDIGMSVDRSTRNIAVRPLWRSVPAPSSQADPGAVMPAP